MNMQGDSVCTTCGPVVPTPYIVAQLQLSDASASLWAFITGKRAVCVSFQILYHLIFMEPPRKRFLVQRQLSWWSVRRLKQHCWNVSKRLSVVGERFVFINQCFVNTYYVWGADQFPPVFVPSTWNHKWWTWWKKQARFKAIPDIWHKTECCCCGVTNYICKFLRLVCFSEFCVSDAAIIMDAALSLVLKQRRCWQALLLPKQEQVPQLQRHSHLNSHPKFFQSFVWSVAGSN